MDGNAVAERLYGARQMDRDRELEPYLADAREALVEELLEGKSIGRGYLSMSMVTILTEWEGVDISEPAQQLMAAVNAPGDGEARFGDLTLWLRKVAEGYVDSRSERIEERAEEMLAAAREAYEEDA